jgi:hypothetical protein
MNKQPWNYVSEQISERLRYKLLLRLLTPVNEHVSSEVWNQLRPRPTDSQSQSREQGLDLIDHLNRKMK